MKLILSRLPTDDGCTIGLLKVGDKVVLRTLEPIDRDLTSSMSLDEIQAIKIHGKTAIPTGTYSIQFKVSNKLGYKVPWLQDVPGFEDVYLHIGNYTKDTEGCILVGLNTGVMNDKDLTPYIGQSTAAFMQLMHNLEQDEVNTIEVK